MVVRHRRYRTNATPAKIFAIRLQAFLAFLIKKDDYTVFLGQVRCAIFDRMDEVINAMGLYGVLLIRESFLQDSPARNERTSFWEHIVLKRTNSNVTYVELWNLCETLAGVSQFL